MNARDLLARHGEHAERIVVAQVGLDGEGKLRQVGQLLEFTRARLGGGLVLQPAPADLRQILGRVIAELELAYGKNIGRDFEGELTGSWDSDLLVEVFARAPWIM